MRHPRTDPLPAMQHLRALALQILAQHGWIVPENPLNGDSPVKTFHTAVGPKSASVLVYLNSREPLLHLQGTYESEGRNVLAADVALIPTDSPRDRVEHSVLRWIAGAEKTIAGTYAMRLRDGADTPPGPMPA